MVFLEINGYTVLREDALTDDYEKFSKFMEKKTHKSVVSAELKLCYIAIKFKLVHVY